jgi:hypothetical protein
VTSGFGQGYAVCLRQFLWHEPRLGDYVREYRDMGIQHPGMFGEKRGIEMWADGAVDHLFDIRRPRRWTTNVEWKEAQLLRDTMAGAKWGPGFASKDEPLARSYSEADMRSMLALAERLLGAYAQRADRAYPESFQAAWDLDEAAGLRPQRGDQATCEGPIPTRDSIPSSKKATP